MGRKSVSTRYSGKGPHEFSVTHLILAFPGNAFIHPETLKSVIQCTYSAGNAPSGLPILVVIIRLPPGWRRSQG